MVFNYMFEANTDGQITCLQVSSGKTNTLNNFVQLVDIVKVTNSKITVHLFSTSNQSTRNWRTTLIRLGS